MRALHDDVWAAGRSRAHEEPKNQSPTTLEASAKDCPHCYARMRQHGNLANATPATPPAQTQRRSFPSRILRSEPWAGSRGRGWTPGSLRHLEYEGMTTGRPTHCASIRAPQPFASVNLKGSEIDRPAPATRPALINLTSGYPGGVFGPATSFVCCAKLGVSVCNLAPNSLVTVSPQRAGHRQVALLEVQTQFQPCRHES